MEQFKEYVKGCNEVAKKWVIALIVCNVMWAVVFGLFLWLSYSNSIDYSQTQNYDDKIQEQHYTESGD